MRLYTMRWLPNPIMDSIRRFGLHPPQEETQTDDQGTADLTSFADTMLVLSGNQTLGAHWYRDEITGNDPGLGTPPLTSRYRVGVFHQIRERSGGMGVQEFWFGTVTAMVKRRR